MTDRQKQYLLGYLGYYSGDVDGIWGPKSRQAEAEFLQRQNLSNWDETAETRILSCIGDGKGFRETENWWQTIRYWTREEFRCRCGQFHTPYCDGYPAEPQRNLVELADRVRSHFGRPAHASSGLRCSRHNRDCGGVSNSRHLQGKALDFRVEGADAEEVLSFIRTLPGVRYAYAIDEAYVHMDIG